MTTPFSKATRKRAVELISKGECRKSIARTLHLTPRQVSAIAAHVTMGTYQSKLVRPDQSGEKHRPEQRAPNGTQPNASGILLGCDVQTAQEVFWNPDPNSGTQNPHVLILGESGSGKTYCIACLLAELAQSGIHSVVLDYAQGFGTGAFPREFEKITKPLEIRASQEGLQINPLQIFPSDPLGPINVAQRVADTFHRVYSKIGVQQHAIIRQAVLDAFLGAGILPERQSTWLKAPPQFRVLKDELEAYSRGEGPVNARVASLTASHISTIFVYDTFRTTGNPLSWEDALRSNHLLLNLQLKGLEHTLERAVTEFLLWNLIGYVESLGPGGLRCFIVLDEAHKLSFDEGSPVERILREGRKFGVGVILSSQQPEDFSTVAFSNSATKIVFQIADNKGTVSKRLAQKAHNFTSATQVSTIITKLRRGKALVVANNEASTVEITPFSKRFPSNV